MPSRRRVRLLATVLVFIVVALVYSRRTSIETYRDFVTENGVGGGAVLRADPKAEIGRLGADVKVSHAALQTPGTGAIPTTRQAVAEKTSHYAVTSTATRSISSRARVATSSVIKELAPSTLDLDDELPVLPDDEELLDQDGLPVEIGIGRHAVSVIPSTTTIYWSEQPERFPISTTIQLPTGTPKSLPQIQYGGKKAAKADVERLAVIKEATQHAWNGYREVAWAHDEVRPLTGGRHDPFNGWGATLVDSLDTLYIMGMMDEFDEAIEVVRDIDFTTSVRPDIPLFETTIRYLGGLIGAYDISNRQAKYRILLDKAVELAEILYGAFDTPNRMPETYYRWKPAFASQPHRAGSRIVLAELGSLNLEFTRLAQLTGEPKYYDAVARITDAFETWQNDTRLPGLWPTALDASGCGKPAQVAQAPHRGGYKAHAAEVVGPQQPVPGGNGEMMHASEPVQQGKQESPVGAARMQQIAAQAKLDLAKTVGEPAMGKIIGHGAPYEEGALDGKTTDDLLAELGSAKQVKRDVSQPAVHDVTEKSLKYLANAAPTTSTMQKSDLSTPPIAQGVDIRTGQDPCIPQGLASTSKFGSETFSLGGQADSVYEYLPKMYMLLGGVAEAQQYRSMYIASAEAAIKDLIFKPMTVDEQDILIAGQVRVGVNGADGSLPKTGLAELEHLSCFAGGMFAMGGKLFNRPGDVEIGKKLTDGCMWAYESTRTGIMPESFGVVACEDTEGCAWNQTKYWEVLDPYRDSRTRIVSTSSLAPKTESTEVGVVKQAATMVVEKVATVVPQLVNAVETLAAKVLDRRQLDAGEVGKPSTVRPLHHSSTSTAVPTPHGTVAEATVSPEYVLPPYQPNQAIYTPKPPLSHKAFVQKKIAEEHLPPGFTKLSDPRYILRPEAIESVWYMYRITGDQHWRDVGWSMFLAIDAVTRARYGNAAIDNVMKEAPEQKDSMESFWIAETLKYFYLLFEDAGVVSLDEWVLNTEAHFFRRPGV